MMPEISIVVPFFNEDENVTPLLTELRAVCDGLGRPYEGIFVNDGSRDGTGPRLDEIAEAGLKRERSISDRITVRPPRSSLA